MLGVGKVGSLRIVGCQNHSITRHSDTIAERMKSYMFVFVIFATVLLYTTGYAREICAPENCLTLDMCDEPVKGETFCQQQGTSCCSIVKSEFRTHCRHHSGVCMDNCASALQRNAVDCENNQVCCVLV
ncbi:hypothetical protein DMN91_009355 [Ooceraea biroi]|nr:uncharacterized protein LOC105278913 [Ooceraea biroi]RLU18997.1 hypothetical protein DMN91_009355 [Ooceraea biroi]